MNMFMFFPVCVHMVTVSAEAYFTMNIDLTQVTVVQTLLSIGRDTLTTQS